jgi:hypothetical protein
MRLFVDDVRDPESVGADPSSVVARNFRSAVEAIETKGLPEHVYLDYDLGEYEPTGYDLAKYIIDTYLMPTRTRFPSYSIHSASPIGRQIIEQLISSYHRFLDMGES